MKKVIQFGAGNIGRGFTGQLFSESGFEVVFVDVVQELVDAINTARTYPIRIACEDPYIVKIDNVRAVSGRDIPAVAGEILDAQIICTAVGVNVLPHIAPAIAEGIRARAEANVSEPVNIIICENLQHMSTFLKNKVLEQLDSKWHPYVDEKVGFVESVVGRMVPVMTEEQKAKDPLLVVVEPYKHLPIAAGMIKGDFPEIAGIELAENFQSYVDRKLYAHNAGHACAAYFGYLKGYEYLYQVMRDTELYTQVRAAMGETGKALIAKHNLDPAEHQAHIDDLLGRFANVALGDQVSRVGRDPVRKLGPEDRLVGGAKLCVEYSVTPTHICRAIAAALLFNPEDDPSAHAVQKIVAEKGPAAALEEIGKLPQDSQITQIVLQEYAALK